MMTKNEILIKSSKFHDGMYTVHGVLTSPVPTKIAYDFLLDVGNSHNVYRNITGSDLWLTENGEKRLTQVLQLYSNVTLVPSSVREYCRIDCSTPDHFEKILNGQTAATWQLGAKFSVYDVPRSDVLVAVCLQYCGWNFLFFAGTFPVVLDVIEEHDNQTLEFNLIESKFMKYMKGYWQVTEADSGLCKIDHTLSVKPVLVPPGMIGSFTRRIFAKQVTQILQDLQMALEESTDRADSV